MVQTIQPLPGIITLITVPHIITIPTRVVRITADLTADITADSMVAVGTAADIIDFGQIMIRKKSFPTLKTADNVVAQYAAELEALDQRTRALWAADCAERALKYFAREHPEDDRPQRAIEGARAWAHGEISMMDGRRLAVAAHAAARSCKQPTATAAARATGHAVATAHSKRHARGGASYTLLAIALESPRQAEKRMLEELKWQKAKLAKYIKRKQNLPRKSSNKTQ